MLIKMNKNLTQWDFIPLLALFFVECEGLYYSPFCLMVVMAECSQGGRLESGLGIGERQLLAVMQSFA